MSQNVNRNDPALVNPEAERTLLGRILADESVWWSVCDALTPDDFGLQQHADTYRGMVSLSRSSKPISIPTLISQVKALNAEYNEASIGMRLASFVADASREELRRVQTADLIEVIRHRSICRGLASAGEKIKQRAMSVSTETPIEDIVTEATKLVSYSFDGSQEAAHIGALIGQVIMSAEELRKSGKSRGIRTKLGCFDDLVGSLLPGQVVVIAGETSSGKTSLATEIGYMVAVQGLPVYMPSLEMEDAELAIRIIGRKASVSATKIADGDVSADETARMLLAGESTVDVPFWIDSRPNQTVGIINARLSRAIARHGIKLAIIDHLQYVRADNPKAPEREQIKQVIDDIKSMAKRLQIPIIVVSHVTRQQDFSAINCAADIKRPVLADLYGSSAIEKAADIVVFVHRPVWFLERATPAERFAERYRGDIAYWQDRAELVMPKRRGGKGFAVKQCFFQAEQTWFSDHDSREDFPL